MDYPAVYLSLKGVARFAASLDSVNAPVAVVAPVHQLMQQFHADQIDPPPRAVTVVPRRASNSRTHSALISTWFGLA